MTLPVFIVLWAFVGIVSFLSLSYWLLKEDFEITVGDLVLGAIAGPIITGLMLIGLMCRVSNKTIYKSKKKE